MLRCRDCRRRFTNSELIRFKTPTEVIRFALRLKQRGGLSNAEISRRIKKRLGYKVSRVTVSKWIHNSYLKRVLLNEDSFEENCKF